MPGSSADRIDLDRLAALARLRLRPEQEGELRRRLTAVVAAFATVSAVDTRSVAQDDTVPANGGTRTDEPAPPLDPALVLGNASSTAAGAFLVPRVVDG
jgi:aspartyl-tRNA(Asn)/glutamyl-tRNA(Gln) amidotransferase subunit C